MENIIIIALILWSIVSAYKIVRLESKLSRLIVFVDGFMQFVVKKGGDNHE